ncbi:stage III sporulation protein AF [Paraliobacillus sediminis]|uniref:stage III sporulation protein AF n=1 Tax=Paraliobacillus sediminis TaxID=1885916 RepID=UPI0013C360AB|nr:stage III sporulation protein AF [Paraliobacillus sediminis]
MSSLKDWITQIIVFLLLVMIIEMLIPQTKMKKYVHTVLSLLFLLLFLQPLFQFLNMDIKEATEQAMMEFEGSMDENTLENEIELKKNEIQASQDAYVVEEILVQMKKQVEEELNNTYGVTISDISFQFDPENNHDIENLKEVTVFLLEDSSLNQGEVEEIVIGEPEDTVVSNDTSETKRDEIKTFLNEVWELEEETLVLVWEGGT